MHRKLTIVLIIIFCLDPIFYVNTSNPFVNKISSTGNLNHNKIQYNSITNLTITSNQDFLIQAQIYNWKGSGTKNDPIIIQNYVFNTTALKSVNSSSIILIDISNVDLFFTIEYNLFFEKEFFVQTNYPGIIYSVYGISVSNSSNGKIYGNNFESGSTYGYKTGITISNSTNLIIQNNNFNANSFNETIDLPFGCAFSDGIIVNSNSFFEINPINGVIKFYFDNNSYIFNNIFKNSFIFLQFCINSTFENNTLFSSVIFNELSYTIISYNILKNWVSKFYSALEIFFLYGANFLHLNLLPFYGITVENNLFQNNSIGIEISKYPYSYNITCPSVPECSNLPENYSGMTILHYTNTLIRYNEFENNSNRAIYIGQYNDNNTIYGNDFINNNQSLSNDFNSVNQSTTQVFESQLQNSTNHWFYNGTGNYWSDYNYHNNYNKTFGLVPMHIIANDSDPFPEIQPFKNTYRYLIAQNGTNPNNDLFHSIELYSGPIIIVTITAVLALSSIYVLVEYRKYIRLGKGQKIHVSNFRAFLTNNFKIRTEKNHVETLTEETFKKIEEILEENK